MNNALQRIYSTGKPYAGLAHISTQNLYRFEPVSSSLSHFP